MQIHKITFSFFLLKYKKLTIGVKARPSTKLGGEEEEENKQRRATVAPAAHHQGNMLNVSLSK